MTLDLLARLAGVLHGGTLATMALLLLLRGRLAPLGEVDLVRLFRATGAILGVSLGAFILGELAAWPGRINPGAPFPASYALHDDVEGIRAVVFGVYWASYIALEIWTLEPCRLLDRDGGIVDPVRYRSAAASTTRHLAVNATLFLTVLALGIR